MTLTLHFFVTILQESDLLKNLSLKKQKQTQRVKHIFYGQMEYNSRKFIKYIQLYHIHQVLHNCICNFICNCIWASGMVCIDGVGVYILDVAGFQDPSTPPLRECSCDF